MQEIMVNKIIIMVAYKSLILYIGYNEPIGIEWIRYIIL